MAQYQIFVTDRGVKPATIDNIVKDIQKKLPRASVTKKHITRPESRKDRYAACIAVLEDMKTEMEEIRNELQDWYDNLPENFQQGDKGNDIETAINEIDNSINDLDQVIGNEPDFPTMYS